MSINSRYSKRIRSHPRRAMKRTLFPAVMLFLLTSCVTVRERDDTSLRTWRTFHAGFDRMWGVLVSEISSFAVIKTIDKANGLITTEPLKMSSGLMSETLLKLYARRPSNILGTWDDARTVLSFLATSKGSSTTVRITARFTGFESSVTHSWMEWPTKGVLENFLLDRIANDLGAPSASAARRSKLANNERRYPEFSRTSRSTSTTSQLEAIACSAHQWASATLFPDSNDSTAAQASCKARRPARACTGG